MGNSNGYSDLLITILKSPMGMTDQAGSEFNSQLGQLGTTIVFLTRNDIDALLQQQIISLLDILTLVQPQLVRVAQFRIRRNMIKNLLEN